MQARRAGTNLSDLLDNSLSNAISGHTLGTFARHAEMAVADEGNALPRRQFPRMFLRAYYPGYRKRDKLYLLQFLAAAPQTAVSPSPLEPRWTALAA